MIRRTVRTTTRYVVNGREYRSLDEMPAADRKLFADANRNGIPDALEGPLQAVGVDPASLSTTGVHTEHVIVESRVMGSDAAARLLEPGDAEAPPLPGEVRSERTGAVRFAVSRRLLWGLIVLLVALLLLSLLR